MSTKVHNHRNRVGCNVACWVGRSCAWSDMGFDSAVIFFADGWFVSDSLSKYNWNQLRRVNDAWLPNDYDHLDADVFDEFPSILCSTMDSNTSTPWTRLVSVTIWNSICRFLFSTWAKVKWKRKKIRMEAFFSFSFFLFDCASFWIFAICFLFSQPDAGIRREQKKKKRKSITHSEAAAFMQRKGTSISSRTQIVEKCLKQTSTRLNHSFNVLKEEKKEQCTWPCHRKKCYSDEEGKAKYFEKKPGMCVTEIHRRRAVVLDICRYSTLRTKWNIDFCRTGVIATWSINDFTQELFGFLRTIVCQ